jgi:DEAD/DEAH box helicase domain-containing protein
MVEHALDLLGCPNCQNACQNCLLQFDTKKYVEFLDRRLGLGYLTRALINSLGLQEEDKIFGESSQFCQFEFFKEVKLSFQGKGEKIQIFLKGNSVEWEISESSIRKHLSELLGQYGKFNELELWMETASFQGLDSDQKLDLFYLMAADTNISLYHTGTLNLIPNGEVIATNWKSGVPTTYASKEPKAILFDKDWSNTRESMLVKAAHLTFTLEGIMVNLNELIPVRGGNAIQISLVQELNSKVGNFGTAFWNLVRTGLEQNGFSMTDFERIRLVDYSDRFLHTPWTVILLTNMLNAIPFQKSDNLEVVISTEKSKNQDYQQYRNLTKNWYSEENDDKVELIKSLLSQFPNVEVNLADHRSELSHSRELNLEFENGKVLNLRLDQGVGYWKVNRFLTFPFDESIQNQINWINANCLVMETLNSQRHPTYIDVKVD